ncbi:MAG: helix-turn-helix transcriptional regulator [Firmicutes bacterium]|nr:helix-turn-helix transcriptional regulator [Christensenellaceae bacterium]MBQ4340192.1 helix-turn-helix transcriptional regulator [Bacillota bacterium]
MKKNSALGQSWDEVREALFTPEELAESQLKVAIIGELIKARVDQGLSQRELETLSGVKQPVIARIEKGNISPQISTLLKILAPLGKTLAVVPMSTHNK